MANILEKGRVVYRIERPSGQGPYCSYNGDDWKDPHHYERTSIITPSNDGTELWREKLEDRFGYWGVKFGFTSLEQLYNWFSSSELSRLQELGFSIKEYEVLEGYYSNYQCVFSPLKKEEVFHE